MNERIKGIVHMNNVVIQLFIKMNCDFQSSRGLLENIDELAWVGGKKGKRFFYLFFFFGIIINFMKNNILFITFWVFIFKLI